MYDKLNFSLWATLILVNYRFSMHDSLLSWKSHRIALYNEIRPQFDFLNRVEIFYQIIVIYKKLNYLDNKYIVNVHQNKSVYLI
jgi:hypothetical protein